MHLFINLKPKTMAIVQKFVNCSTSTTPNQQIPMDRVSSFDKIDAQTQLGDPTVVSYNIIFSMDTLSPQRSMTLKYTTAALRNASYNAIKAAAAQTTV